MEYIRRFSIQKRLWVQLALIAIGLTVLVLQGLSRLQDSLMAEKVGNTKGLVEVAHSIASFQYGRSQAGEISEAQAKDTAREAIEALRYDGNNYFWIQDVQPRMIMHPFKPELNGTDLSNNADPTGKKLFVEMASVARASGEGMVPYMWPLPGKDEPVEKVSYVKSFKPWGWVIGSGVYVVDVREAYWSAAMGLIVISIFVILAVGALAFFLARSISIPLGETAAALDDIAAGEGDLTQRLKVVGNDEVSSMASSFNAFVGRIEGAMIEVRDATLKLGAASAQLKSAMDSNENSMQKQMHESQSIATAITEMASTVNEIAKSAENAAFSAGEANQEAEAGNQVVSEAIISVNSLAKEVREAGEVIHSLNSDTQSITSVLEVITGIAEQTNLLALNAAIEAARAGEQGRGFAVVADEVRTLAARTQSSTEEIRQMIDSLQGGSAKAVAAMESGQGSTEVTVTKAETAGESLIKIVAAINSISDMNMHIASAAEQQSAAAQEIDRSIVIMSDATADCCREIEATAASTRQLAELSESLDHLVSDFKLSDS